MPWLAALLAVILLLGLVTNGIVTAKLLSENKEVIDTASKILALLGAVVAGALAYFRFFGGRTLSPKLTIDVDCAVNDLTPDAAAGGEPGTTSTTTTNLHVVEACLENIGSRIVRNFRASLTAHGPDNEPLSLRYRIHPGFVDRPNNGLYIDVGQKAYLMVTVQVPKELSYVAYVLTIRNGHGTMFWHRPFVIANRVKAPE